MGNTRRRYWIGIVGLAVIAVMASCASGGKEETTQVEVKPKILHFYASQPQVPRGTEVLVCYGVEGADSLRLLPIDMRLSPSLNRCVAVTHSESTEYRLEVTGGGETIQSDPVRVAIGKSLEGNAPKPASSSAGASSGKELIRFFSSSAQQVPAGEKVTFCYGTVAGVRSVTLEPAVMAVSPASQQCFEVPVNSTQTYILRATGEGGASDAMQVKVAVQ